MKIKDGKLIKITKRDVVKGFLKIPDGVDSIAWRVLSANNNIKKIYIPKSLTNLSFYTFEHCSNLQEIEFDDEVKKINMSAFSGLPITSIKLPKNLEIVEGDAFSGTKIKNMVFPNSVKEIGSSVFNSCSQLESVVLPENLEVVENALFAHCRNLIVVEMPKNVKRMGSSVFLNCNHLEVIEIPTTISKIERRTFEGCQSLENIRIPQNIKFIGESGFLGCRSLKNVNIENGLRIIGSGAFSGCGFSEINLPESLEAIESNAFQNCTNLKSISIPNSVNELYNFVFENCKQLESVKLPNNLTKINRSVFENCESLKEIEIPETVSEILEDAFNGCTSLKTINLPKNIKCIADDVFTNCTSLKEVFIPDTLERFGSMENTAFAYFTKVNGGFVLTTDKMENSISTEELDVNPLFLSKYWNFRNIILKEQKNPAIASFFSHVLLYQPKEAVEKFLNSHNYTFFKQFKNYKEFDDEDPSLLKLLYTLGGLDKPFELNGKQYNYSQKVCEFLLEKYRKGKFDWTVASEISENLEPNGFKKDFTDFFLQNYDELIKEEMYTSGFIANCYNRFEDVQRTNTNNHGSQRQLKPTIEKFKEFFLFDKFKGITEENKHIAMEVSKFFFDQDSFEYALQINQERQENKVPNNILGFHLVEKSPFENIDKYTGEIKNIQHQITNELGKVANNEFTFDWLEKNDPENFILGKYCSCCSHLEGVGFGIMHASIVNPNVQNLVIRDKNNVIIAKSTLYVNPKECYGVCNNVEINSEYLNDSAKLKIYKKFIEAINAFAIEYNKVYKDNPLKQINVGMGNNDLKSEIEENNTREDNLLKAIDYAKYGNSAFSYSGDSKLSQYIIWKNNGQELQNSEKQEFEK